MRQIKATESFLGLDKETRKCQNEEPYLNCTTRQYYETMLEVEECGCLPLNIRQSNKVCSEIICPWSINQCQYIRIPFALQKNRIVSAK